MNIIIKDNDDLLADFAADLITSEIQKNQALKFALLQVIHQLKLIKS
ncbi:hypothetical protein [Mycoplasmopsis felis]|nr:hypothetical protein [Mycoplasmopsis felis]UWV84073.1 hypothetical protein NWE58_00850 [Mycoplasmopsis felis]UWW00678.1 hypothetical protein NW064_05740 [Mycoplasmopsis felis]